MFFSNFRYFNDWEGEFHYVCLIAGRFKPWIVKVWQVAYLTIQKLFQCSNVSCKFFYHTFSYFGPSRIETPFLLFHIHNRVYSFFLNNQNFLHRYNLCNLPSHPEDYTSVKKTGRNFDFLPQICLWKESNLFEKPNFELLPIWMTTLSCKSCYYLQFLIVRDYYTNNIKI